MNTLFFVLLCLYSRAADWNLGAPDWKGRMRLVSLGEKCLVKLEDRISGWAVYVRTELGNTQNKAKKNSQRNCLERDLNPRQLTRLAL